MRQVAFHPVVDLAGGGQVNPLLAVADNRTHLVIEERVTEAGSVGRGD